MKDLILTMDRETFVSDLRKKDDELNYLREKLLSLENAAELPKSVTSAIDTPAFTPATRLTNNDISRYSRQLILPEIGPKGQLSLAQCSVLIVGAGGLGCPAAIYLAAAGIGRIGIVDYDEVEISNLHRQILHTEYRKGKCKSASIAASCNGLNSTIQCVPYHLALDSSNALEIIKQYDIILDATDNLPTRYLLNDACVFANKPLISGSALQFEGQLRIYNYKGGPCYRCMFPKPPRPDTVTNCSDGGVLGVVPGIIGSLQALEAIKIAIGIEPSFSKELLLFDSISSSKPFRCIKLRGRNSNCDLCGDQPTITELIDYEQFCSSKATDKTKHLNLLDEIDRISVQQYNDMLERKVEHVLVDVRQSVECEICKLPAGNMINVPIADINRDANIEKLKSEIKDEVPVIVVCRQGNDSQKAVQKLRELFNNNNIQDICGGLYAWSRDIDETFPVY